MKNQLLTTDFNKMNNKKLIEFILKDLGELEELIAGKGSDNFDELEWEFLQTRISGAKRMITILFDRENTTDTKIENQLPEGVSEKTEVEPVVKEKPEEKIDEKIEEPVEEEVEENVEVVVQEKEEKSIEKENVVEEKIEEPIEIRNEKLEIEAKLKEKKDVELDEEELADESRKTLGDSFHKERSVNDLIDLDKTNLEQKLSNRPVINIKSAIGINDRFQFIRELFDGNADMFSKAVTELDAKNDIKEAVEYLQQNFKWKKNETSLKFVNLVKRRFTNE